MNKEDRKLKCKDCDEKEDCNYPECNDIYQMLKDICDGKV